MQEKVQTAMTAHIRRKVGADRAQQGCHTVCSSVVTAKVVAWVTVMQGKNGPQGPHIHPDEASVFAETLSLTCVQGPSLLSLVRPIFGTFDVITVE